MGKFEKVPGVRTRGVGPWECEDCGKESMNREGCTRCDDLYATCVTCHIEHGYQCGFCRPPGLNPAGTFERL